MACNRNARFIQKHTDYSYQKALHRVLQHTEEASALAQEKGYSFQDALYEIIVVPHIRSKAKTITFTG